MPVETMTPPDQTLSQAGLTAAHRKLDKIIRTGETTEDRTAMIHDLLLDQLQHPEGDPMELARLLSELISMLAVTIGEVKKASKEVAEGQATLAYQIDQMKADQKARHAEIVDRQSQIIDLLGGQFPDRSER